MRLRVANLRERPVRQLHRRQVQQAQLGTVLREVHEGVERTAARGFRSAFPGSPVAARRDAYVERLDGGESLRDRTQVGGSALEVEVAR